MSSPETVVVLNPVSGSGDHVKAIRRRAERYEYAVRETEGPGDARQIARDAADEGASLVAAAGGDGTLNEVVRGVASPRTRPDVTVAPIPVGTGNNFAENVGLPTVDAAFDAVESGERRTVDLAWAGDRPFVNSCVGGLTADASDRTTSEQKRSLGVLAYLVTTLQTVTDYGELAIDVSAECGPKDGSWSGEAIAILVGNGRRFTPQGSRQAHLEDGLLEVTVVEDASSAGLVRDAVVDSLLDADAPSVTRFLASSLAIDVLDDSPTTFSLDGETIETDELPLDVQPRALELVVGDHYDPDPGPP